MRNNLTLYEFVEDDEDNSTTVRIPPEMEMCVNDCSNNGECDGGVCICENGYLGVDCAIHISTPPTIYNEPENYICDGRTHFCERGSLYGQGFVDIKTLSCHYQEVKPMETINYQYYHLIIVNAKRVVDILMYLTLLITCLGNMFSIFQVNEIRNGTLRTANEVQCPFTDEEEQADSGLHALTQVHVSISNDAEHKSESVQFTKYDSKCMDCSTVDNQHVCQQKVWL